MLSVKAAVRTSQRVTSRLIPSKSVLCKPSSLRPTLQSTKGLTRSRIAPFSTSFIQKAKAKNGQNDLASALQSEITMEKEMSDGLQPASVKDFLENGPFEVIDLPGRDEVVLTRKFGDEKIHISFSVSDINMDSNPDFGDRALDDEDDPENSSEEQKIPEEEEDDALDDDSQFPVRLNIIIEKPSKGAVVIEAGVQDGIIVTDSILYCKDVAHAYAKTPESLHERRDLYLGPPFHNLDENLQVSFEKYLDERGINSTLAVFVPEYINMKEQTEYVRWLGNMKAFVS